MKILFLDIDGPLIPTRIHIKKGYGFYGYDYFQDGTHVWDSNFCLKLAEKFDGKIVFNSSHNTSGKERILKTAINNGIGDLIHEDVITKYPYIDNRVTACRDFLERHNYKDANWIVIDDFELPTQHLINVTLEDGMTPEKIDLLFKKFQESNV